MEPIEKLFHADNLFPFQLVYKDTKSVEVELPYHFHEWYELIFVHKGNGTFFINHSIQSMEKGSVFIIPGNTLHRAIPDVNNPVTSTAIFFNPLLIQSKVLGECFTYYRLFDDSTRLKIYKLNLSVDEQTTIENIINNIHNEFTQEKLGYRHAVLLELQYLLLSLSRGLTSHNIPSLNSEFSDPMWMKEILNYIEGNFCKGLTLPKLAQFGNISTAHLSRVFKQMTGFNVSEYIMSKKILKAKELLLNTDKKVSCVALQCGFESLPHFHRTFKKLIGSTPSDFRKRKDPSINNKIV